MFITNNGIESTAVLVIIDDIIIIDVRIIIGVPYSEQFRIISDD